jgi:hypothetical protein
MLILNMFIYKNNYEKKFKNSKYIILVQMYEMKIQMHFESNYVIFLLNFFYRGVHLRKIFKNEIYFFSFGQNMKMIIMVKVDYFYMGQRM